MDEMVKKIFGAVIDDKPTPVRDGIDPSSPEIYDPTAGSPSEIQTEPMTQLARFVMEAFRVNAEARRTSGVDKRLQYALDAHTLRYNDDQRERLKRAGIDDRMFSPITFTKIRSAKALLMDLVNGCGDPLFKIEPSPDPDVGKNVEAAAYNDMMMEITNLFMMIQSSGVQEIPQQAQGMLLQLIEQMTTGRYDTISNKKYEDARVRARRMQKKVWDLMEEGHFMDEFQRYLEYLCTYGTAVMIGPVTRVEPSNECIEDEKTGVRKFRRAMKAHQVFEAVNPMDCYPAPDALNTDDGPFCIRTKYSCDDLWGYYRARSAKKEVKSPEGWNYAILGKLLSEHPHGGVHVKEEPYGIDRRLSENGGHESDDDSSFEGVRCFASVRGSVLAEMGIIRNKAGKKIEYDTYYRAEVVVIDGLVVFCRLYDERLDTPISKSVFYDLPGSWWGESIADKLFMCQYVQNNCVKALVSNMAVASGPQIWINDTQRLVSKSPDALKMRPFKIWAFNQGGMVASGAPMGVMPVPSNATELLNVFDKFRVQADLDSGIPAFTEGQSAGQGGALRTASGLAMYTEATTRGMKMCMTGIDYTCIRECARRAADWIIVNDDDMDAKGDVHVRSIGLIGRILKAQRDQQRLQLLSMVLNSQILQQIVGPKGVMAMFRPSVEDVDINPDDVVPNEERMKELELIEQIKQVFQATANANAVQQNVAAQEGGGGAPPGVAQPPQQPAPGTVNERRGVA